MAAPLLPRFIRVDERAARELRLRLVLRDGESSVSTPVGMAGGDAHALRGIPAVTRSGVGSAIPGTQPETALLAKED